MSQKAFEFAQVEEGHLFERTLAPWSASCSSRTGRANAIPISPSISRPPKGRKDRTLWRTWIPDLIIEVVSESSRDRDYTEKRDEYWTLGVKEFWIVDAKLEQVLLLKRGRSQWTEKTLDTADVCETKLLPGSKLTCGAIFEAAGEEREE